MKIMDCTLRDGANVVGNGFSPELTKMMIEGLLRSNIRIIEMGNAKGLGATEKGSPAPISDVAYLDLIHPYLGQAEIGMFLNAKRFEADNVAMAADKGISSCAWARTRGTEPPPMKRPLSSSNTASRCATL